MRLTRRDAIAALGAAGAVGVAGCGNLDSGEEGASSGPVDGHVIGTMIAAAEVLYPDGVVGIDGFVEEFLQGRVDDRPRKAIGIADAAEYLDAYAEAWTDERFGALDLSVREEVFRRMNVADARPDPEGSDVQRVRYFVVNELLFAFYASPTGGALVGIENPQGHPGGITSYRRGPHS